MNMKLNFSLLLLILTPIMIAFCVSPVSEDKGNNTVDRTEHGKWINRSSNNKSLFWVSAWTGKSLFVAGKDSVIYETRDNGNSWAVHYQSISKYITGIAWNGSLLVAVGDSGIIMTSEDGAAWTKQQFSPRKALFDLCWLDTQFVAVGQNGLIITSKNGIDWRELSYGKARNLFRVISGNNNLITIGDSGCVLISKDGSTWNNFARDSISSMVSIVWTGNQLVAVGGDSGMAKIWTSSDGISWIVRYSNTNLELSDIISFDSQLIATGSDGTTIISSDGINWVKKTIVTPDNYYLREDLWDICHLDTQIIVVGTNRTVMYSKDGINWAYYGLYGLGIPEYLTKIIWAGSQYVAFASSWGVVTSPDGVFWSSKYVKGNYGWYYAAIWTGNHIIGLGTPGSIITSTNGKDWILNSVPITWKIYDALYYNQKIMAVGNNDNGYFDNNRYGYISTSTDGINWTSKSFLQDSLFHAVVWSGSQFVVVGKKGAIFSSADGILWTKQNSTSNLGLSDIVNFKNRLIVIGDSGLILSSVDGYVWNKQHSGTNNFLKEISCSNTHVFVLVNDGTVIYSKDGIDWKYHSRISETINGSNFNSIACVDTQLLVVGNNGSILSCSIANIDN